MILLVCAIASSFLAPVQVPAHVRPSSALATRPLFADLHELLPERRSPSALALGDIDQDGDLDAFVAQGFVLLGSLVPELWRNEGNGRMRRMPLEETLIPYTPVADFADLDGDSDLDLLAGSVRYWNDGLGRLEREPLLLPAAFAAPARSLADLDGDGDLDVYLVAGTLFPGDPDALFLNDGTGSFVDASATLPAGASGAGFLATGDVDGDGDLDVLASGLVCSPCVARVRLYLNDGAASFSDASANLPPALARYGFALADVDGDLDLDALSSTGLLLNDGTGHFADASAWLPASTVPGGLPLDIDADGDVDLLGPGRAPWLNDGTGQFAAAELPPAFGLPGDLDGDGDVDLLLGTPESWDGLRQYSGSSEYLLNDGRGSFLSSASLARELPGAHGPACALADMDGDGDLDALSGGGRDLPGGSYEQKTFLAVNDGHGRFTDPAGSMPRMTTNPTVLVPCDADGDGDMDLLVGGNSNSDGDGGGLNRMFQVDGGFENPDLFGTHQWLGGRITDLAAGDVDGDGDLDVLHGNPWTSTFPDGLLANDGAGSFTPLVQPALFLNARVVELFDFDHDGDLDVLVAGAGAALFRNDGTSWSEVSERLGFTDAQALESGDVDLDGDADLLVAESERVRVLRNDAGTFGAGQVLAALPAQGTLVPIVLTDVDDDGDLDVLIEGAAELLENDGRGRLAPGALRHAGLGDDPVLGDLDQDGDLDLFTGHWPRPAVLEYVPRASLSFGLVRQLAWRTPPQLGRAFTLDLRGPRDEPWKLYSSPREERLHVLGKGTLLLGPPLTVVATGAFDRHGRATWSTLVPAQPALIGQTLFWQALAGSRPRFGNREITTISGH